MQTAKLGWLPALTLIVDSFPAYISQGSWKSAQIMDIKILLDWSGTRAIYLTNLTNVKNSDSRRGKVEIKYCMCGKKCLLWFVLKGLLKLNSIQHLNLTLIKSVAHKTKFYPAVKSRFHSKHTNFYWLSELVSTICVGGGRGGNKMIWKIIRPIFYHHRIIKTRFHGGYLCIHKEI